MASAFPNIVWKLKSPVTAGVVLQLSFPKCYIQLKVEQIIPEFSS